MTREEILGRYRRDRAISVKLQTGALAQISRPVLLRQAKRLGLSNGKVLRVSHDDELTLVFDLLLYTTTPPLGRSRAIDRYARVHRPVPGSDEARVLSALQGSRFSLFQVKERHPMAGLIMTDLLREGESWLMDEGLEASAQVGAVFGTRLARPDTFALTCGALVPIDSETLGRLASVIDEAGTVPAELADDPRFAEFLYQLALQLDLTGFVSYR
ncbi:MAG TPA: hypothetical protein VHK66_05020 [Microvirga sp.]|nr:hypothetical protein [Microvirga sp.]